MPFLSLPEWVLPRLSACLLMRVAAAIADSRRWRIRVEGCAAVLREIYSLAFLRRVERYAHAAEERSAVRPTYARPVNVMYGRRLILRLSVARLFVGFSM